MNKFFKVILVLLGVGVVVGGIVFWYVNRPTQGAGQLKADFTLTTTELIKEVSSNASTSEQKFAKKNLQISGNISSIEKGAGNSISVFFKEKDVVISCSFSGEDVKEVQSLKEGAPLKLKGLYKGSTKDDLLGETQIDLISCSIVK